MKSKAILMVRFASIFDHTLLLESDTNSLFPVIGNDFARFSGENDDFW